MAELSVLKSPDGTKKVEIIKMMAPRWKDFGYLLDFDDTGITLDLIRAEKRIHGYCVCCQDMFQQWLRGDARTPATWKKLIELLEDFRYRTLADDILTILQQVNVESKTIRS